MTLEAINFVILSAGNLLAEGGLNMEAHSMLEKWLELKAEFLKEEEEEWLSDWNNPASHWHY